MKLASSPSRAEQRLSQIINARQERALQGGLQGLEKECLRVSEDGLIAQTPHPPALGSALSHSAITTDFAEALLEFKTEPVNDPRLTLTQLQHILQFVNANLQNELMWASSMPCLVAGDESIQIARYGTSNAGMLKHIYRRGLGYRYGKVMQAIAGIHFNYSLPKTFWLSFQELERDRGGARAFRDDRYFGLVRNALRFGWLVLYLFGASPAVCKSFLRGQTVDLQEFDRSTYYDPYATSLRMSDIGYTNKRRGGLHIPHDSLAAYTAGLRQATATPYPPYEAIGVFVDGEYRQLNANLLQIENEYYSAIRPKQSPRDHERSLSALEQRGVEYVEFRIIDLASADPLGINEAELRFLEAFLIACLLHDSPPISAEEQKEIEHNQIATARHGRDSQLQLRRNGRWQQLQSWGLEWLDTLQGVCEMLDAGRSERLYANALALQREALLDADRTPSAQLLHAMRTSNLGFFHYIKRQSENHREFLLRLPFPAERQEFFARETAASVERQNALEAGDKQPFADYLSHYLAQS